MKKLLRIAYCVLAVWLVAPSALAQLVTADLSITNNPTNGYSLTVNGAQFIWTNATPNANYVLITNTLAGDASNLFTVFQGSLGFGVPISQTNGTNLIFYAPGMSASVSTNWASLTLTTNAQTTRTNVVVPISVVNPASRTNVESQLVADENNYSTNPINQNAPIASELMGLTNAQTVSGAKNFSNTNNQYTGFFTDIILYATNAYPEITIIGSGSNWNSLNVSALNNSNGYAATRYSWFNVVTKSFAEWGAVGVSTTNSPFYSTAPFDPGFMYMETDGPGIGWVHAGLPLMYVDTNLAQVHIATNGGTADVWYMNMQNGNGGIFGTWTALTLQATTNIATVADYGTLAVTGSAGITNLTLGGTNAVSGGVWCYPSISNPNPASGPASDIWLGTNVFVTFSGLTGALTNVGFVAGQPGEYHIIKNGSGFPWAFVNNSSLESTLANRINVGTGGNTVVSSTNNPSIAEVYYDASLSQWVLINLR